MKISMLYLEIIQECGLKRLKPSQRGCEMRPYELRRSVRCPKKYGETIKERTFGLAPGYDLAPPIREQTAGADPQPPLDDRFRRNAAVIPDLVPPLPDRHGSAVARDDASRGAPLLIHGFTVPDYQRTYHSVVDPLLLRAGGKPAAYSLQLGHAIKQRLFQELSYPLVQTCEQPDGRVAVTERFCVLRPAPRIDIECDAKLPKHFL